MTIIYLCNECGNEEDWPEESDVVCSCCGATMYIYASKQCPE